jgi:hypothetical protein
VRQRVEGLLGKLWWRFRDAQGGLVWNCPNGKAVEKRSEKQTDLVLSGAAGKTATLDEARVRTRRPQVKQVRKVADNL